MESDGELRELVLRASQETSSLKVKDRKYRLKTYHKCFIASEYVDWIMAEGLPACESRSHAINVALRTFEAGLIEHVCQDHPFSDSSLFFVFSKESEGQWSSPRQKEACEAVYSRLKQAIIVRDRHFKSNKYRQCFVTSEALDWLEGNIDSIVEDAKAFDPPSVSVTKESYVVKYPISGRELCLFVCELLRQNGYIRHVVSRKKKFKDGLYFFRFIKFVKGEVENSLAMKEDELSRWGLQLRLNQLDWPSNDRPPSKDKLIASSCKYQRETGTEDPSPIEDKYTLHIDKNVAFYSQQLFNVPHKTFVATGLSSPTIICVETTPVLRADDQLVYRSMMFTNKGNLRKFIPAESKAESKRRGLGSFRGTKPSLHPTTTPASKSSPSLSLVHSSLADIMAHQAKDSHRGALLVPSTLDKLTTRLSTLDAQLHEGIFRVPGDTGAVAKAWAALEDGDDSVIDDESDVDVLASLLKKFIREAPDPWIPTHLFHSAVQAAESHEDVPQKCMEIINALPIINRRAIHHLCVFLTMFTTEESMAAAKMGLDNISTVFGPSILRPESDVDPLFMLEHSFALSTFIRVVMENHRDIDLDDSASSLATHSDAAQVEAHTSGRQPARTLGSLIGAKKSLSRRSRSPTRSHSPTPGPRSRSKSPSSRPGSRSKSPSRALLSTAPTNIRKSLSPVSLVDSTTSMLSSSDGPSIIRDGSARATSSVGKAARISAKAVVHAYHVLQGENVEVKELKSDRGEELSLDMKQFEEKMIHESQRLKWGVLYAKSGQNDEDEIYRNDSHSDAFDKFLTFLGERVSLGEHEGYMGGLQRDGSTGEHSVYTQFHGFQVMFHVQTLIPTKAHDEQAVYRKRHLGNDIVILVFKDEDDETPFDPCVLTSHFNHVFCVVQPRTRGSRTRKAYRVAFVYKSGVVPSVPSLRAPGHIQADAQGRAWLLTKLINCEHSALQSTDFQVAIRRTRTGILNDIIEKHGISTSGV